MSKIEDMIKSSPLSRVKKVLVRDIIEYHPGGSLTRQQVKREGLYPVMNGGIDYSGFYDNYNYDENVLTISHWGSSASHIHRHNKKFWANNACWVFTPKNDSNCLLGYLYYILKNKENIMASKYCFGGATPNLNRQLFERIQIPLPPLTIQREIVSVLDSFTTLIDKMKQEVELRKKQMEYYSRFLIKQIITDKVSISSFTKVLRGRRLTKNMLSEDYTYPVFHGGNEPIGFYKEANRDANSVMIINVGASAGTVGFCNSNFWSSDGCFCLQKNKDVLDKYVYYALKNKEKQIMSMVRNAGIPTLDANAVEKVEIPLPSLSTQRSIVSTLDAFEQYISKLERLITLREKQYAYYCEKLLTFE